MSAPGGGPGRTGDRFTCAICDRAFPDRGTAMLCCSEHVEQGEVTTGGAEP